MITALLTSVNYNDFLDFLLPKNLPQFDEIIVLTVESDTECKKVCDKYEGVRCLVFEDSVLKKNGKNFNKGALYNKGLEYLDSINYTDWLVFTDADILFPDTFREMVDGLEKKQRVLYTLDRYDCETYDVYKEYAETKDMSLLGEKYYCPFAGYCQLFIYEPTKMPVKETGEADVYDWQHLRRFGRPRLRYRKKQDIFKFLSEDEFVLHLGVHLLNINGRITGKYFDDEVEPTTTQKRLVVQMPDTNAGFFVYPEFVINGILYSEGRDDYANFPHIDYGEETLSGKSKFYDSNHGDNVFYNYFRVKESVNIDKNSELVYEDDINFWWHMHDNIGVQCYPHDAGTSADLQKLYDTPYTRELDDWYRKNRVEANRVMNEYFEIKPNLVKDIDSRWEHMFDDDEYVVGVHIRGTDKQMRIGGRKIPPEEYYPYIDYLLERNSPDGKIFLATDDSRYFDIFSEKYGERIKSLPGIMRGDAGTNIFLDETVTDNYAKGLDVLADCVCLSKCNFLLKSASAVSEFAVWFNNDLHKNSLNLQYDCKSFLSGDIFGNESDG